MIKKADIFLGIILVIIGGILSYFSAFGSNEGDTVYITVDGIEFGTYALYENREVAVKKNSHLNEITIKDGSVSMVFSDCANQVCVNTGLISKTNQTIVCLPNKVMVQILGKGEAEYDAISN